MASDYDVTGCAWHKHAYSCLRYSLNAIHILKIETKQA